MKSRRSGALKPGKLGLSCKVNKCTGSETGVVPFHETSPMNTVNTMVSADQTHTACTCVATPGFKPKGRVCM